MHWRRAAQRVDTQIFHLYFCRAGTEHADHNMKAEREKWPGLIKVARMRTE